MQRLSISICVAVFGWSLIAGAQEAEPGDRTETLDHNGIERTFHIHLPPKFDRANRHPLALVLHGGGGSGKRFDRSTRGAMTAAGDERGFVLVFPEGMRKQWNDGRTEHLKGGNSHDDVGFLSAVIDRMIAKYAVDAARAYATGISNGGFMSVRLGVDLAPKIAAVAPVAAQLSVALKDRVPARPVSILIMNGTRDPLVPYDGGEIRLFRRGRSRGRILSTADTVARFVRLNGCEVEPTLKRLPDRNRFDGATAQVETYRGGKDDSEVVLVKVIGGGHTWPGGRQYLPKRRIGAVCRDFDASAMILDFFLRHRRAKPGE